MYFFKLSLFFTFFLCSSLVVSRTTKVDPFAKSIKGVRRCGSHSTKEQREASRNRFINDNLAPRSAHNVSSSEIKVYFHVIAANKTEEGGWVSDKQIHRQIQVLNEDYNYTGISFKLVNTTRTINKKWFEWVGSDDDIEATMKDKLRVGGPAGMNVFSVGLIEREFAGYLGFATMPENYKEYLQYDGIFLNQASFPDGALEKFDMGKTLTHEAGHWLGLYHTFDTDDDTHVPHIGSLPPPQPPPPNRKIRQSHMFILPPETGNRRPLSTPCAPPHSSSYPGRPKTYRRTIPLHQRHCPLPSRSGNPPRMGPTGQIDLLPEPPIIVSLNDMPPTTPHNTIPYLVAQPRSFIRGECDEGDQVDDTPPEAEPAFGCPIGRDSCKGGQRDAVHNFMNYGDDYCLTDFTEGQIKRMKEQIRTYRGIYV
ncbi:hypothetical protein BDQ17DRAFT_1536877 [Cyathus striatus]|nr:hypothetical protein BDQ17DRAFT_1536877 [Cyathus striatus]